MIKKKTYTKNFMRILAVSMAVMTLFACTGKEVAEDENEHHPLYNYYTAGPSMTMSSSASMSAAASTSSASSANAANASPIAVPPSYQKYGGTAFGYGAYDFDEEFNTEEYDALKENPFKDVSLSPLSTFSADVDTASYANIRRFIYSNYIPETIPKGAVRIEEMINYFNYDYDGPKKGEPFGVNAEISDCPWDKDHKLVRIGLQTEKIDYAKAKDSNIVLLIDVSGSMYSFNKLPLVQESFCMMVDNLSKKDRVSIVTYASGNETVLEGVSGADKDTIKEAINSLTAYGGTNGAGGIEEAYRIAKENFIKDGNNRVIIATDGDFNLGITSESELSELIKEKAEEGIFLSVLGYGMGNYSDSRLETLADDGNGNYAYIDSAAEAKKVLVEEFGANMVTVAKDVKLQVEFNPAYVKEYRLLGYEDRMLNTEDFEDDTKDAGEIGAGHSVTVLYEIVPAKNSFEGAGLKYQTSSLTDTAKNSDEWLTLKIRYKAPAGDVSNLLEYSIGKKDVTGVPSDDFMFAAAVAEFGMILRRSEYVNAKDFEHVKRVLKTLDLNDDYRKELADMVEVCIENSQ